MNKPGNNVVPIQPVAEENPNRLPFSLEEMLAEFDNGQVPRSTYWKAMIRALYETANHIVTGVTAVADVRPDEQGNIPLSPYDIDIQDINRDVIGRQLFYGDACKLESQGDGKYRLASGTGYVGGIKFFYSGKADMVSETLPSKIWLDVSWSYAKATGGEAVVNVVWSQSDISDYTDEQGVEHFVEAIASVDLNKVITDCRLYPDYKLENLFAQNIKGFSVKGDGVSDDTQAIKSCLGQGGFWYFPKGTYLVKGAGADKGGIDFYLKNSIKVICHPEAIFKADQLDNDIIRMIVHPSVNAESITIDWEGGIFDQCLQKTSTVVPSSGTYPSDNQGASATSDGLSIRGSYLSGGHIVVGVKFARISKVSFKAGNHWQKSGGDSGLFTEGCVKQHISDCYFMGNRDCGIYTSADETGSSFVSSTITNCTFINCFHGASVKRSGFNTSIRSCNFLNCVKGMTLELLIGRGLFGGEVSNNYIYSCGVGVRLQSGNGVHIVNNTFESLGAELVDGTIEPHMGYGGILVYGGNANIISGNVNLSEKTVPYNDRFFIHLLLLSISGSPSQKTSHSIVTNNIIKGWTHNYAKDDGQNNYFGNNTCPDGNPALRGRGVGTVEIRAIDGFTPNYNTPLTFFSSTYDTPLLHRYEDIGTGLYMNTGLIGLASAVVEFSGHVQPRSSSMNLGNASLPWNSVTSNSFITFGSDGNRYRLKPPSGSTAVEWERI